jgi:hypothetical protein
MVLTVGLVAAVGVYGLGLPLGAAILLGAILAPTDPVLASDVQVDDIGATCPPRRCGSCRCSSWSCAPSPSGWGS